MASVLDDLGLGDQLHKQSNTASGDPAVWTLLGEAGTKHEGWLPVASTIHNRAQKIKADYNTIVTDPAQGYEAWQDPKTRQKVQQEFPVDSDQYKQAAEFLNDLKSGKIAPLKYDAFYSPEGQAAKNRPPPDFENGKGVDIAGNRFFDTSGKYASVLEDIGLNDDIPDSPAVDSPDLKKDVPPAATTAHIDAKGGKIVFGDTGATLPTEQAASVRALDASGNIDATKPAGHSMFPYVQRNPSDTFAPGSYYINPNGEMHITPGGPPDNFSIGRNLGAGLFAGSGDVPLSVMRMLPGHDNSDVYNAFKGQQLEYNAQHENSIVAKLGRFGGQLATSAPALAALPTTAALGGGLSGVTEAGMVGGGVQSGLTSGSSNRPLAEQLIEGTMFGGIAGPVLHGLGNLVSTNLSGLPSRITELADIAQNKFGINLRAPQIKGAADAGSAAIDQRLQKAPGSGFSTNAAQQPLQYTRAVGSTFGVHPNDITSSGLTPSVMSAAKQNIGNIMNGYAVDNTVTGKNLDTLLSNVNDLKSQIRGALSKDQADPLVENINNIVRRAKGKGFTGQMYKDMIANGQPFDHLQDSGNSTTKFYAAKIRDELDNAFERAYDPAVGGTPLEVFKDARLQYKNLMTAKNAIDNNGHIDPSALDRAVSSKFKNRAFSGAGDLGDLADIGQLFLRQNNPSASAQHSIFPYVAAGMLSPVLEGAAMYAKRPDLILPIAGATGSTLAARYGINAFRGAAANNALKQSSVANYLANKFAVPAATIGANNTQGNK